ncbi:MAG: hypothetical protein ACKO0W_03660 [Planctomycetota bacterium]|jgi:hypothetical protein
MTLAAIAGLSWPEISLLFFLTLFIALVVRLVFSKAARWQSAARIPLDDSAPGEAPNTRGNDHV